MTTSDPQRPPSVAEIAALTPRLRHLGSPDATDAERAAFQVDKTNLLDRIPDPTRSAGRSQVDAAEAAAEAVMAWAAAGGYAMVGPSARTWSVDPATGIPTGPVPEAEHRLVRQLIGQERLDGTEPVWLPCADGGDEIVALVVPAPPEVDDPALDGSTWYDAALDTTTPDGGHLGSAENNAAERPDPTDRGAVGVPSPQQVSDALAQARRSLAEVANTPVEGWRTVSAAEAAGQLVGRGYDVDTARALVVDYMRDTSERIGAPAHEWGLDQGDVDAIDAAHRLPEAARAVVEQDEADADRGMQLGRWHTDDQAAAEDATNEADDGAPFESVDETGWSE